MEVLIQKTIKVTLITCAECAVEFGIPVMLEESLRQSKKSFYCPHGHSQWFPGETREDKLRRELKRKEQELADQVQEKLQAINNLLKAERKLKRVSKGVCPCCNRTFADLQRHMKTKHPETIKNKG